MTTQLERLVVKEQITITFKPGTAKPTDPRMSNWRAHEVTLKYKTKRVTFTFFSTPGYEPKAADVIATMCLEAKGLEETGGTFEEWAKKFGYSPDSRTAYATWEGMMKSSPRLKNFLGRKWREFADSKHI